MSSLEETQAVIADVDQYHVVLALDLWAFADDPFLRESWDLLVRHIRLVLVADRSGPLDFEQERLLPGAGRMPLDWCLRALADAGYQGDIEIDPVGEAVSQAGYEATLAAISQYRDELGRMLRRPQPRRRAAAMPPVLAEAGVRPGHP
jgi:sugar phosphate isomerase/epimerase